MVNSVLCPRNLSERDPLTGKEDEQIDEITGKNEEILRGNAGQLDSYPADSPTEAGDASLRQALCGSGGCPDLQLGTAGGWRAYEQANGSVQTPMTTSFNGENVNVRLDLPPTDSEIVDFKDYNWSSPGYSSPFLQQQVISNFQNQIQLYQTIRPNVILQFSQQPPQWVIGAINQVGGSHRVGP